MLVSKQNLQIELTAFMKDFILKRIKFLHKKFLMSVILKEKENNSGFCMNVKKNWSIFSVIYNCF